MFGLFRGTFGNVSVEAGLDTVGRGLGSRGAEPVASVSDPLGRKESPGWGGMSPLYPRMISLGAERPQTLQFHEVNLENSNTGKTVWFGASCPRDAVQRNGSSRSAQPSGSLLTDHGGSAGTETPECNPAKPACPSPQVQAQPAWASSQEQTLPIPLKGCPMRQCQAFFDI